MRACGTLLARFHQAGNRIAIPKAGRHNGLGSWPAYLRSERNKMLRSIRKAKRNGFGSPLDGFLQKHGNEILRYANISLRALQSSNYRSLCRKAKRTLCHGDCGPSNIIRTRKGMYLLDFETMRIDLRAYDLYRIIYNSCKDHRWNFAIARSILDGYQKVFKLGRSDYRMLKMLLLFPREACKLIQEYSRITPRGRLDILKFFPRTIANERRRLAFIKKLDAYARKH
jgi:CotS family spore coat protein